MDRRRSSVVLLNLLLAWGCATPAAQSKNAVSTAHAGSAAQDTTHPEWREMTWSEYYSSVMQNARRRGATVIWVNPPDVHTVDRDRHPIKAK
jgi:hypothetical protein